MIFIFLFWVNYPFKNNVWGSLKATIVSTSMPTSKQIHYVSQTTTHRVQTQWV